MINRDGRRGLEDGSYRVEKIGKARIDEFGEAKTPLWMCIIPYALFGLVIGGSAWAYYG